MSKDGNYNVNYGIMVFFKSYSFITLLAKCSKLLGNRKIQNDSTDAFQANITACVTVIKKSQKCRQYVPCVLYGRRYIFLFIIYCILTDLAH